MIRSCFACRRRAEPSSLLRLQLNTEKEIQLVTIKQPNQRSMWVCCDLTCIEKLKKKRTPLENLHRPTPHPVLI